MRLPALVLASVFLLQLAFTNRAQADLLDRIRHKFHKVHSLVHTAFDKLGHDPNATILVRLREKFPEATKLLRARARKLAKCYEASLGGEKMSIFERPLVVVVKKFIVSSEFGHVWVWL